MPAAARLQLQLPSRSLPELAVERRPMPGSTGACRGRGTLGPRPPALNYRWWGSENWAALDL
eukprot:302494-Alexandrium_andersonii.AAC.1